MNTKIKNNEGKKNNESQPDGVSIHVIHTATDTHPDSHRREHTRASSEMWLTLTLYNSMCQKS